MARQDDVLPNDWRALLPHIEIAHHITGRIRLRLVNMPLLAAVSAASRMQGWLDALRSLPGIASVEVNVAARSGVIVYDPAAIAPQTWPDLVANRRTEQATRLLDLLDRTQRDRRPG